MNRHLDFILGVPALQLFSIFSRKISTGSHILPKSKIPHKLLIIKLAAVGDTILLIPVFRSLRRKFPNTIIHLLASNVNESIAKTIPYVDEVLVWKNQSWSQLLNLLSLLKKNQYDTVIDLEQWARGTAILGFLTGASNRLGFDTPGQYRAALYTQTIKKPSTQHEIQEFFNVCELLGPLDHDFSLELWESEMGKMEVQELLPELGTSPQRSLHVLLHPGCGKDGRPREWPLTSYGLLGQWIMKKYQANIFLSGGPEETQKTLHLNKLLNKMAIDMGGKLTWQGMVTLVSKMDVVISGNTAIMHMGAAFRKKQIALHGPTDPQLWGPRNSQALIVQSLCPHCPCLKLGFEYHATDQSCMSQISTEAVKEAFAQLFDKEREI